MTPRGSSQILAKRGKRVFLFAKSARERLVFLHEPEFPDWVCLSLEEYCREVLLKTANARL
jgi:hypothetical protein